MKYKTVSITLDSTHENFKASIVDLPYDRKAGEGMLAAGLGFYHFPVKETNEVAFEKLRSQMVRNAEISLQLEQRRLEKLKALKCPVYKEEV